MITVAIEWDLPGGGPAAYQSVIVVLVHGGAGGSYDGKVIGSSQTVKLNAAGIGSIALMPNDQLSPPGTYYRFTLKGSAPTVVRLIQLATSTTSPINLTDASIQVYDPDPPGLVTISDDHALLSNREAPDQHPMSAITGLEDALAPEASTFVWDQTTPSATWTITHTLPFNPNVTLVTSAGDEFTADSVHHAAGVITVTMLAAQGGKAYLS